MRKLYGVIGGLENEPRKNHTSSATNVITVDNVVNIGSSR